MTGLAVKLSADTAEFESDMGRASHIAGREMEAMVTRANAAGKLIGDSISRIAGNFAQLVGETLKAGDELSKLSQRSGFAVENLSELQFAAQLSDVSFGQLTTGLGFFNKTLVDAQNEGSKAGQVFRTLGVDINSGPQKAFEQFTKAVNSIESPETKVAAMRLAFSRAGDALIPMIGSLEEAREKARNLGIVMGDDLAKRSERLNDALTALNASTRALAIQALTPSSEAIATIAENMVKARERGDSWKTGILEIAKVAVAAAGEIGSMVPIIGKYNEQMAQAAFNRLTKLGESGIRPIGPAPNAVEVLQSQIDEAKLKAQLAGVKAAKDKAPKKPRDESERIAREMARGEEELAKEIAEAWSFVPAMNARIEEYQRLVNAWGEDTFIGMSLEDAREWVKLQFQAIDGLAEIEEKSMRAAAGFTEEGKAIEDATKKADDWAKSLGLTFTSAFENAAVHGKKLRDVLKGIGDDIARMILRKTVTEPLGKALEGILSGGLPSVFGGASAPVADAVLSVVPSYDVGSSYVPRTGLAMVHQGERIIPASQNRSGGGPVFEYVDLRGASVDAVARLERFVQQINGSIESRAVGAIAGAHQRGEVDFR